MNISLMDCGLAITSKYDAEERDKKGETAIDDLLDCLW
jgi:hypothetical protein